MSADINGVRRALNGNANVNVGDGDTLLHRIAVFPFSPTKLEIAQLLLDRGALVNAQNHYNNSPLFYSQA